MGWMTDDEGCWAHSAVWWAKMWHRECREKTSKVEQAVCLIHHPVSLEVGFGKLVWRIIAKTDWLRALARNSQKAWVGTPAWPLPGDLTSQMLMFSCKIDRIRVDTFWGCRETHWANLLRVLITLARQRVCLWSVQAALWHSYICKSKVGNSSSSFTLESVS